MKTRYLLILLFIAFTNYSFSQILVKGSILDNEGEALIGATVSLTKNKQTKGGSTDINGNINIA